MEYLEQNTSPNQANLEPRQILDRAKIAADSHNWTLVNQNLQRLPISKKKSKLASIAELELERAIDLAWQVLLSGDFQQRWQIVNLLAKFIKASSQRDALIIQSIELLENKNTDIELRWYIGRILGEFDDPDAIVALIKLMHSTEEEELAIMASEVLTQIGTAAIESLSELLADENSRLLATRSLAAIRKIEIVEPLLTVIKDASAEVRAIAIEALSSFNDSRIDTILIEALTDTSAAVRKEAVVALGVRRELCDRLNLVERIEPLLYDLNLGVCRHAAIALGRIGNRSATAALFKLLKSSLTPIELQIDSVRALSWSDSREGLDYLQKALSWSSETISQEIVTVLGRGVTPNLKPKATQILVDYLHSGQATATKPEVKKALAMSIGELGGSGGIVTLNKLAEDTETTVRLHAIAALKKIGTRD